jgi:tellurite resistance protein TehA-like permease
LLLVVATQSLAVLAALLAPACGEWLVLAALAAWAVGLVLYPPVLASVFAALRRRRRLDPELWIVMGALAIATLAGTEVLVALRALGALRTVGGWLPDVDLATWAAAAALVMPLLAAELRTRSWSYHASRWSFVFPLGMYGVAGETLGRAEALASVRGVGTVFVFAALAAWAVVVVGLVRSRFR